MDTVVLCLWIHILALFLKDCECLRPKQLSDEEKLLDYLFSVYNPSARPVLNSSETVTVGIQFSLLQIQDLNVRNQVLTTTGLLILDWHDERLTWTPEISHLDEMVINGKSIWKPEFAVINGAEGIYEDFSNFQAVLYPNGHIHWEPGGVFKTMCTIDITYYPFDSQKCDMQFGAWSYYTSKMNLTTNVTEIRQDSYKHNGEWHILKTSVERSEFAFACCPDQKFSNVFFSVYMRRRHTFYIMNVILPGIMTSAVLLSIFFCTPSQKVHIGVAALLSFRLFLLNVADTIPRTSDHVPLLGIYLTCTMAITTLAMVATVFVLNLYGMKDKPVPKWAKKIFVIYIARLLCMCDCFAPPVPDTKQKTDTESLYASQYGATNLYNTHNSRTGPSSGTDSLKNNKARYRLIMTQENRHILEEETDTDDEKSQVTEVADTYQSTSDVWIQATPTHQSTSDVWVRATPTHQTSSNDVILMSPSPSSSRHTSPQMPNKTANKRTPEHISNNYTYQDSSSCVTSQRKKAVDYSTEWVHVAAVCDRLFFWLCFLFIVITTMLLFHPLTTSRFFKIPVIEDEPNG